MKDRYTVSVVVMSQTMDDEAETVEAEDCAGSSGYPFGCHDDTDSAERDFRTLMEAPAMLETLRLRAALESADAAAADTRWKSLRKMEHTILDRIDS